MNHKTVQSEPIPIVDAGSLFSKAGGNVNAISKQWAAHMESGGYLCIVNHGIPESLIQRMREQALRFHQMRLSEKLEIKINQHQRGYITSIGDRCDSDLPPDTTESEAFVLATEHSEKYQGFVDKKPFYARNQWPSRLPEFKSVASECMGAMVELGKRLLPVWATALDLESDYFKQNFTDDYSYFRVVHYPPRPGTNIKPSNAHVDAGFMTISPRSNVAGLQIQKPDGNWIYPDFPSCGLTVFAGAFLELWSNGRFKAARHRVLAHPQSSRYSLPCFVNPGFDTVAQTLPTCGGITTQPGGKPPSFWEFFSSYMYRTYSHFDVDPPNLRTDVR